MIGENGYVNDNKLMSYISRIIVHNSDRGLGKSHGERKRLIKRYLRKRHRFVCLYRTKNDRDAAINTWMDQFYEPPHGETFGPLPRDAFKWKKSKNCVELYYKMDRSPIGYFLCVAHVNAIKQMVFPDTIRWGWMDEYLPEAWTKLPGIENEGLAILKIMDTIEHDSLHRQFFNGYPRVRWAFYGNIQNLQSPLLQFFGVSPFKYGVYRGQLNGAISRDVIIETELPALTLKTGDFSNAARIYTLDDNERAFVCKKPEGALLKYSLRIRRENESHYYHVYHAPTCMWIEEGTTHKGPNRRGTLLGKRPDEITLLDSESTWRKSYMHRYSVGYMFFNHPYTKIKFLNDII